jgi:hypothetical protein
MRNRRREAQLRTSEGLQQIQDGLVVLRRLLIAAERD